MVGSNTLGPTTIQNAAIPKTTGNAAIHPARFPPLNIARPVPTGFAPDPAMDARNTHNRLARKVITGISAAEATAATWGASHPVRNKAASTTVLAVNALPEIKKNLANARRGQPGLLKVQQ
ncbi:hypothetical protein MishRS11D_18000 [Methylomagnum ishizawai]|nr:hypothetical protein MishRS11D_18000 [Methylomagnum ishizawai]